MFLGQRRVLTDAPGLSLRGPALFVLLPEGSQGGRSL